MVILLFTRVGEDKVIKSIAEGGDEYMNRYDISIDVDRTSLVISSGYMTIWKKYKSCDDLLNGIIKLLKVTLGDNAKVDMGDLSDEQIDKVPGLRERMKKWYNARVTAYADFEKKQIELAISDEDLGIIDTVTLEFHDVESFLRALDEYSS